MDYSKQKVAVLLFNLGGPDSIKAIRPFLFNLFNDKYILRISQPFRFLLAKIISTFRHAKAAEIYALIGNKSPINEETFAQATKLEEYLTKTEKKTYKVFVAMKNWHPFFPEALKKIKKYNPEEVVLLPLYPQYSTTTTLSFLDDYAKRIPYKTSIKCCYHSNKKYCNAITIQIKNMYIEALKIHKIDPIVIFSAHSLPVKIIKDGDPYQWQIEQSVKHIVNNLEKNFPRLKWIISYQSKIGPVEWLRPNTEEIIKEKSKAGEALVVVPISFVSEHSETLVELDIEYKALAKKYFRVPTLSINDLFIESLADIATNKDTQYCCPKKYKQCWKQNKLCKHFDHN